MTTNHTGSNSVTLSTAALATAKCLPEDFLKQLGVYDLLGGGVGIPYYDETGQELYIRERGSLACNGRRFHQPAGVKLSPYGLWRLDEARKAGWTVLCEGESDTWACWHHGTPALGIPGAQSAGALQGEHIVAMSDIFISKDNDNSGEQFMASVSQRLRMLGYTGRVWVLIWPSRHKDLCDVHTADPAAFPAALAEAKRTAHPLVLPAASGASSPPPRSSNPRPRRIPKYHPLPLHALAGPLRDYVENGAHALGCDPAYLALPCIAATASAIGNSRVIRLKNGWEEPCIFWTAIIGDSGTLKSPAWRTAVRYLFRKQGLLVEQHEKDLATYTNDLQVWKEAQQAFKNGKGEDPGEPPKKPRQSRIICADITVEKLAEILEDNPRGLLVSRDELAGWLASFTRYKSKGAGSDLPNWLEMFQAGTVMVDRKTGERRTFFVPRANVSVTGGIQPGVLVRALTPEFLDAGLAARLLMAMPPRLPKVWTDEEVPFTVVQGYQQMLDSLLTLDFDRKDGESVPHVMRLSKEGKRAWVSYYNAWAKEQAVVEGELAAAFSKLEGYTARFALLHHVISGLVRKGDEAAEIGEESVEAGVAFSRWCAQETRRIYTTLSESDDERNSRRLVEYIRSRGGLITVKALQNSNSRKYPSSSEAEAALAVLVAAGLGRWEDRPAGPQGGRPTRAFVLLPTTDDTDETPGQPDVSREAPCDETSDDTSEPRYELPVSQANGTVSSVSSVVVHQKGEAVRHPKQGKRPDEVSSDGPEVSSDAEIEEGTL